MDTENKTRENEKRVVQMKKRDSKKMRIGTKWRCQEDVTEKILWGFFSPPQEGREFGCAFFSR